MHPGVVQKAERFVAAAQLKLASSLPREVLGRLRVVVHTHTEVEVRGGGRGGCCGGCAVRTRVYLACSACLPCAALEEQGRA